jgi:hypothetical protein
VLRRGQTIGRPGFVRTVQKWYAGLEKWAVVSSGLLRHSGRPAALDARAYTRELWSHCPSHVDVVRGRYEHYDLSFDVLDSSDGFCYFSARGALLAYGQTPTTLT